MSSRSKASSWLAKMLLAAARKELNNVPLKFNSRVPGDSRGARDRAQAGRRIPRGGR